MTIYTGPPLHGWELLLALVGLGSVILGCIALLAAIIWSARR